MIDFWTFVVANITLLARFIDDLQPAWSVGLLAIACGLWILNKLEWRE
jgi:hypothetical protein